MTGHRVVWQPAATRQLRKLPPPVQAAVLRKVTSLAADPRPHGSIKLTGSHDLYRIRSGRYRVIYTVDDARLVVTVVKVAIRDESTY